MDTSRIEKLTNAFGPAGFETEVARLIPNIYKGSNLV